MFRHWLAAFMLLCAPSAAIAAPCVTSKPLVVMSDARVDVAPGAQGVVHFYITNTDSIGCREQVFDVGPQLGYATGVPADAVAGYGLVDIADSVTLAPGATVAGAVQVRFTATAPEGKYTTLYVHAYPRSDDPDVYFYQSGLGRTNFYVAEPGICINETDRDAICALLCGYPTL